MANINTTGLPRVAYSVTDVEKKHGEEIGSDRRSVRDASLKILLQYSPGLDESKMRKHLDEATLLQEQIINVQNEMKVLSEPQRNERWQQFIQEKASPQAAIAFAWILIAKGAEYGDIYTSGAISLQNGAKFEEFLIACGKKDDLSYPRISTHNAQDLNFRKAEQQKTIVSLKQRIKDARKDARNDEPARLELQEKLKVLQNENITQWGIDLRDMGLPAGKHTILFSKQSDGSLFFKTEQSGVPPFYKTFRFRDFVEFLSHTKDYILSKLRSGSGTPIPARKENVDKKIKQLFQKALNSHYFTWMNSKETNAQLRKGKKEGLSTILNILCEQKVLNKSGNELKALLEKQMLDAINRGLSKQGIVRGNEIIVGEITTQLIP